MTYNTHKIETPKYGWLDSKIVPWEDSKIHVRSQGGTFGLNAFEGIRGYWNEDHQEMYLFKVQEHLERLERTMKIMRFSIPYTTEDLTAALIELTVKNQFRANVHYMPVAYRGIGQNLLMLEDTISNGVYITGFVRPRVKGVLNGIHTCVSSWRRIPDDIVPPRIKTGAVYINNFLSAMEARQDGYDSAIMLTREGKVAEGVGCCLYMVREGRVVTPTITSGILESITRSTLIELFAAELGIGVVEREIDRTELYDTEEAFFCGTAAEVMPIVSVDRIPIDTGEVGAITKQIQKVYLDIVEGRNPKYSHWLTPVYRPAKAK